MTRREHTGKYLTKSVSTWFTWSSRKISRSARLPVFLASTTTTPWLSSGLIVETIKPNKVDLPNPWLSTAGGEAKFWNFLQVWEIQNWRLQKRQEADFIRNRVSSWLSLTNSVTWTREQQRLWAKKTTRALQRKKLEKCTDSSLKRKISNLSNLACLSEISPPLRLLKSWSSHLYPSSAGRHIRGLLNSTSSAPLLCKAKKRSLRIV